MDWLTKDLQDEIRLVLERKYRRNLTDDEIWEIAESLISLCETIIKQKSGGLK